MKKYEEEEDDNDNNTNTNTEHTYIHTHTYIHAYIKLSPYDTLTQTNLYIIVQASTLIMSDQKNRKYPISRKETVLREARRRASVCINQSCTINDDK